MPFKIVQTIERGRSVLTAVPYEWESNGILCWPKKYKKLRKIEDSKPEPNWKKINCIVERSNLHSFREAELEIDAMSSYSDTENDNELTQIQQQVNIDQINFNEIAEEGFAVCTY